MSVEPLVVTEAPTGTYVYEPCTYGLLCHLDLLIETLEQFK